jgi:MoaA/NifB/PqqE/SkfB family radical SAM enzyme
VAEGDLLVVVCQVTQACNLGCSFCGYDRRLSWPRRAADPQRLARLGRLLADFQDHTGRSVLVSWLGGEPLQWPPLAALAVSFRERSLALSVTTNGTALGAPAVREHLLDHYAEVTVSVDGLGPFHDDVRAWPGGFAFLRRAVTALAEEKGRRGRGPRVRVNTVLMRDNVDSFEALCVELAGWGVEEITWNALGGNERPEFYAAHRLRPADVTRIVGALPRLRAALAGRGVRILGGPRYLERVAATSASRAWPVAHCGVERRFLFVSLDGRVAPCSFTTDDLGVPLGAIDTVAGLAGRLHDARLEERPRACDDCHSTQVFGKFQEGP